MLLQYNIKTTTTIMTEKIESLNDVFYEQVMDSLHDNLRNHFHTTPNEPKYLLMHPTDSMALERMFNEMMSGPVHRDHTNGELRFRGIKILRSYDIQPLEYEFV